MTLWWCLSTQLRDFSRTLNGGETRAVGLIHGWALQGDRGIRRQGSCQTWSTVRIRHSSCSPTKGEPRKSSGSEGRAQVFTFSIQSETTLVGAGLDRGGEDPSFALQARQRRLIHCSEVVVRAGVRLSA